MTNAESTPNIISAAKVAGRVDLRSVTLIGCDCKRQQECPAGPNVFDIKRVSRYEIGDGQNTVGVFISFALHAFGEGDEQKEENAFLDIDATFLLLYSIAGTEGLDDEALSGFAYLNGTYNAWPYWREFVQSMTSRMELPPLTIPVFRLPRGPAKELTDKKEDKVEAATDK